MKNQFFYTRKEPVRPKEGETEVTFREFRDSVNLEKVIRSIQLETGQVLLLLDDIHERPQEVPVTNKNNVIIGTKRERNVFQTEVYLSPEDGERFFKAVNYEGN